MKAFTTSHKVPEVVSQLINQGLTPSFNECPLRQMGSLDTALKATLTISC
jgi:hypothetical protein